MTLGDLLLDRMIATADSDFLLVRRMAAGDETALDALTTAYGARLYAYALRITADPACADEVVQDTLIAAWENARRFRGDGRVIAWLLGILHHKALHALRRRQDDSLDAQEMDHPDHAPLPDELAAAHEREMLLRNALGRLPQEQRLALELVFFQEMSLQETAQILGCPLGTIKSRLNYAKNALRGHLNRAGIQVEDIL